MVKKNAVLSPDKNIRAIDKIITIKKKNTLCFLLTKLVK